MLKKVSKIAALFCLIAFSGSAFAQNEVPEYPQYGFWSNWGIGINGSFMWQPDVTKFTGVKDLYFGGGYNAGLGVILQKEVDRGASIRLHYNYTSLFWKSNKNNAETYAQRDPRWNVLPYKSQLQSMDQHSALTVDFLLSLNNSFHNWNGFATPEFIGFKNYVELFTSKTTPTSLLPLVTSSTLASPLPTRS